jgi:hypothetical protein
MAASFFTPGDTKATETSNPSSAAAARLGFILQLLQLQAAAGGGPSIAQRMRGGKGGSLSNILNSPEGLKALEQFKAAATAPGAMSSSRTTTTKQGQAPMIQDLMQLLTAGLLLGSLGANKGESPLGGLGKLAGMIPGLGGGGGGGTGTVPDYTQSYLEGRSPAAYMPAVIDYLSSQASGVPATGYPVAPDQGTYVPDSGSGFDYTPYWNW